MNVYVKAILIMFGFVIILYLAAITTKFIAKRYNTMGQSKYIEVLDRLMLGRSGWIYIIKIGEKIFIIAVAGDKIQTLGEIDYTDLRPVQGQRELDFSNIINKYKLESWFKKGNGENKDED
ncbi:MAG: flagellar biosynthetic protein FliO [Clostridiales bacterium]|nr:flagellar biosynthetic protein FliO [Clostridiales bacterium]